MKTISIFFIISFLMINAAQADEMTFDKSQPRTVQSLPKPALAIQARPVKNSATIATNNELNNDIEIANDNIPIGTVVSWPYPKLPSNGKWRECDGGPGGSEFLEATGKPNVPNYRGMFLRGEGSQSVNGKTYSSNGLDASQGDAVRTNSGSNVVGKFYSGDVVHDASGAFQKIGKYRSQGNSNGKDGGYVDGIQLNLSGMMPVGNEVRPVNKAVKYIIKVKM